MAKKFILDLGNRKQTGFIQIRTNPEEKNFLQNATNKLNSSSPYLNMTISDFIRMSYADFGQRILGGNFTIKINIPEKDISFRLKKQKTA